MSCIMKSKQFKNTAKKWCLCFSDRARVSTIGLKQHANKQTSRSKTFSRISWSWTYDNGNAQALWNVPVYSGSIEVRAIRIDATIVDKEQKRVSAIEMSCPRLDDREVKEMEKTQRYGPLMWELRERNFGYQVKTL